MVYLLYATVLAVFNTLKPGSRSSGAEGAQPGGGIHEWGVCEGGQSASSFVLCLGCFGAAA